ncbi:MAG: phosphonate C-P lyase system protein PhnH [Pseudomonadota bacterium]
MSLNAPNSTGPNSAVPSDALSNGALSRDAGPSDAVLSGGFTDAPIEAARAFRAALSAMARPGRIETVTGVAPPMPLSPAAGLLLLTLCDGDTPLYLAQGYDTAEIRAWLAFQTGAPIGPADQAAFLLGRWEALPHSEARLGTAEYPDRSATLIVESPALAADTHRLTGPGIATEAWLRLPETAAFAENHRRFPLGFDCFFTAGNRLAALPRTTCVAEAG